MRETQTMARIIGVWSLIWSALCVVFGFPWLAAINFVSALACASTARRIRMKDEDENA